jgi:hypothetical protein
MHEDDYEDDGDSDHLEAIVDQEEDSSPEASAEPEYVFEEVGVDSDHRLAQLGKIRNSVIGDDDLTLPSSGMLTMDDTGPRTIVCPNCNSEEIAGQKFCNQCNARLPQLPPVLEQKYNPGSIDGAARKYYDTITNFQAEKISLDEFIDFLNNGLEKVRAHAEHLAELSQDGVMAEWLPEAAELLSSATQLWYDSVEGMLMRVEDAQVEHEEEEALLEELDEEELAEREPLLPLEERIRMIDFTPELDSIFRSNDQMLEYLRIVDNQLKTEARQGGMQF